MTRGRIGLVGVSSSPPTAGGTSASSPVTVVRAGTVDSVGGSGPVEVLALRLGGVPFPFVSLPLAPPAPLLSTLDLASTAAGDGSSRAWLVTAGALKKSWTSPADASRVDWRELNTGEDTVGVDLGAPAGEAAREIARAPRCRPVVPSGTASEREAATRSAMPLSLSDVVCKGN